MQLPIEAYTAPEAFQAERRELFAGAWLPFAATGQLARPGAYVSHSLAGWPLFAIRGNDGITRAFHNRCRHQQMPVIDQAEGQCDVLRCRVHGWTYGLDGGFSSAPPRFAPADPDATANRLEPVALAERGGLLFTRIASGGEPAPPAIDLGGRRFQSAMPSDAQCNWKSLIEMLLAGGVWRLVGPLALLAERDGGAILRQVVPRSFGRSRFVDLAFGAAAGSAESAAADAAAAEAWQARRAAGTAEPVPDAVAAFRRAVALRRDPL